MAERIDCLVPAAGESRRMGEWKPLLPFGGSTIIGTVVAAALEVCDRVVLVTGYRGEELAFLFRGESRVTIVENPDWPLGMFSSIRRGVQRIATERFFVSLGDMPWIRADAYAALMRAPPADVLFPTFLGERGHPVLFRSRVVDAVLRADPSSGSMRQVASGFQTGELPWKDDAILRDVDTRDDYER